MTGVKKLSRNETAPEATGGREYSHRVNKKEREREREQRRKGYGEETVKRGKGTERAAIGGNVDEAGCEGLTRRDVALKHSWRRARARG